jgi:ADP-ribosylation factor protein 6
MGANLSKALSKMFGSKEMRILMLGLDAAGKTSNLITNHLKGSSRSSVL